MDAATGAERLRDSRRLDAASGPRSSPAAAGRLPLAGAVARARSGVECRGRLAAGATDSRDAATRESARSPAPSSASVVRQAGPLVAVRLSARLGRKRSGKARSARSSASRFDSVSPLTKRSCSCRASRLIWSFQILAAQVTARLDSHSSSRCTNVAMKRLSSSTQAARARRIGNRLVSAAPSDGQRIRASSLSWLHEPYVSTALALDAELGRVALAPRVDWQRKRDARPSRLPPSMVAVAQTGGLSGAIKTMRACRRTDAEEAERTGNDSTPR
jgi:hypothetical protein